MRKQLKSLLPVVLVASFGGGAVAAPAVAQTIYTIPASTKAQAVANANAAFKRKLATKGSVLRVLAKRYVSTTLSFPGAGTYTVKMTSGGQTFANGKRTVTKERTDTIKVTLTPAGTRILKAARLAKKSVTVFVTTSFNPAGPGATVSKTTKLIIKA